MRTLTAVSAASAALLIAAGVHADPLELTDGQMDAVTAGVTINPPGTDPVAIAEFPGDEETGTILAGDSNVVLPDAVVKPNIEGGFTGDGPWSTNNAETDVVVHDFAEAL